MPPDQVAPARSLPMSPDRMRWALDQIGWSQRELAARLGANESTIRAMARGSRAVPDELATWLETLAQFHTSFPHPENWRNAQRPV